MRSRLITLLVPLLVLGLGLVGTAAAAPGGSADAHANDRAQERRAEVLAYWTPERVQNAVPRLPVVDGAPTHHRDGHAGGGGPSNDGQEEDPSTDGTVTGAPWVDISDEGMVGETTGKVLFTMGNSNYVCSGSTVDDPSGQSIVLTAGHCVHDGDGSSNSWATNWIFIPAYEDEGTFSCGNTTYGCWTAATLTTTTSWFQDGDFSDDAGFAVMDPGGPSGDSGLDLVGVVGSQAIAFTHDVTGSPIHAFGYPAAQKYKGGDLIYCAGKATNGVQTGTAGLGCDMTGGSSGGPWLANFGDSATGTAVSVNSHVYRSVKNVMFGPVFDDDERAAYDMAVGTSDGARANQ